MLGFKIFDNELENYSVTLDDRAVLIAPLAVYTREANLPAVVQLPNQHITDCNIDCFWTCQAPRLHDHNILDYFC